RLQLRGQVAGLGRQRLLLRLAGGEVGLQLLGALAALGGLGQRLLVVRPQVRQALLQLAALLVGVVLLALEGLEARAALRGLPLLLAEGGLGGGQRLLRLGVGGAQVLVLLLQGRERGGGVAQLPLQRLEALHLPLEALALLLQRPALLLARRLLC